MSELSPRPIESVRDAGRDLRVLRLGGPLALAAPGQCVMVRAGGLGPAPFAAASKPGEPFLELLVKRAPGVAEALWGLKPGDAAEVGPPEYAAGRSAPLAMGSPEGNVPRNA